MFSSIVFEKSLKNDELRRTDEALESGLACHKIVKCRKLFLWISVFEDNLEIDLGRNETLNQTVMEGVVLVVFVCVAEHLLDKKYKDQLK